ncbi:MAG: hypothetical protein U5L72_01735 [Bacteroidales bacterium]|nr:hypothetical protein [Bacteroidales bacterium]
MSDSRRRAQGAGRRAQSAGRRAQSRAQSAGRADGSVTSGAVSGV